MKSLFAVPSLLAAVVAAAAPFAAGVAPAAPPAEYEYAVDPVHSSLLFKVKHANAAWFYGVFAKATGGFTIDPRAPEKSKVEITVDAASLDSRDEKRDTHLRSPDFFDVKQYPEITFTSSKVTKVAGAAAGETYEVAGDFELRGEKKPLTLTVVKTGEGEFHGKRAGYETTFTVKRSDFGMTWGIADKTLGDDVTVIASIEGVETKAGK